MTTGPRRASVPPRLVDPTDRRAANISLVGSKFGRLDIGMMAVLVGLMVAMHLAMPGQIPSGADGGNWLAIAWGRLGVDVMASDVSYPFVFPALLSAGIGILGAVPALVACALLAKGLLVLAIYLCVRPLGRWYAAGAALLCGFAGAQLEAYAWGGYPQLLGTACALLAVFLTLRWLADLRGWLLFLALVMGLLTFATHALIGGLLLFALPLAALHWLLVVRAPTREWLAAVVGVGLVGLPGGIYVILNRVAGAKSGVTAVLNPYDIDLLESIQLAARDAALPWALVVAVALSALATKRLDRLRATTLASGSAWMTAGLLFFLVTGEARALLVAQIGVVLLAGLAVQRILIWLRNQRLRPGSSMIRRLAFPLFATLLISMITAIVVGGLVAYSAAITWYRVADESTLAALDWLENNSQSEDLSATSTGPNGNPLGWWVQGYGLRRSYTGIDVRALSFPDERAQAEIANRIFDPSSSESEVHALIEENSIDFLIVDRRGGDLRWLGGNVAQSFTKLYDTPPVVILDARSG